MGENKLALFKKKNDDINMNGSGTADVDAIMRKYDRESNTRIWEGTPKLIVRGFMALCSLFFIYVTLFATFLEQVRLTSFVALIIIMGYLTYPAKKHNLRVNHMPWYDIMLMALGAGAFLYYTFNAHSIISMSYGGVVSSPLRIVIGIIGVLALVELCRRSVGIPILCVAAFFVIYTFSSGLSLNRVIYELFYGENGVLTTPINVCSKFIVVFIIFGAFLERTGISEFFISLANGVAGASSGGPAKVAVISSALCGMVSGSSVGNTVTTGSVTIPMMKKTGYRPEFAGAVEAAASTGGQIMPPIMGAAAFLMADFVGVPYSNIIVRAILPAFLYFTGIFIAVHLEAKKTGLKGIDKEMLPKMKELLKKSYLLLPLIILIYLVGTNTRTMQSAAAISIIIAVIVSLFNKDNRITLAKIGDALAAGSQSVISVAVACAIAGIITGCITVTGLASVIINAIVTVAGQTKILALFLTMLCCIVLGMGVPTTANYCIMAATCAPILIKMNIEPIAAHFFVFYFGIVADITPPVALAAYAGSAIAGSSPMKTGFIATRLAIAAFIIPYVFALSPQMLFVDTVWYQVVQICFTSFIGLYGVAAGLSGYLAGDLKIYFRLILIAAGLLLIYPSTITDIIGLLVFAAVVIIQKLMTGKSRKIAA